MLNKILLTTLVWVASFGAQANQPSVELSAHNFGNQWEKPMSLDDQTEWLIFSSHKAGGEWVRNAFTTLNVTDPQSLKWLYVADISAMPSLISKFIAIPKMQDYPFAIALEKEGEFTSSWPKREEAVSVYKLNHLTIEKVEFFESEQALTEFLKGLAQ